MEQLNICYDSQDVDPPAESLDLEENSHPRTSNPIVFFLGFSGFTVVAIVIGAVVVYLNSPQASNTICQTSFKATSQKFTGQDSEPLAVAAGYLNDDPWLDLAVANYGSNKIGIFFGDAYGLFGPQMNLSTNPGLQPTSVAIADFNNDHQTDLAVANYGSNSIGIFLGYGNETFIQHRIIALGASRPWALVANDLNNDNQMDIVLVTDGTYAMLILLGNGDGSFRSAETYPTGFDSRPYSIAVTDLNKNTHLDIVITNYGTSDLAIFYDYQNGTFQKSTTFSVGGDSYPSGIVIQDLNTDGNLDLIVSNAGTNNVVIFYGYSNGTFIQSATLITGPNSGPSCVAVGYFNDDDLLDIAVTDKNNDNLGIFIALSGQRFSNQALLYTGYASSPNYLIATDFNHDNRSQLVTANTGVNQVWVQSSYVNILSLTSNLLPSIQNSQPVFVNISDFNNDHQLDFALVSRDLISIFLGYGNGIFAEPVTYSTGTGSDPQSLAFADFNQDGRLDIAVANRGADNIGIFFGHGNGTFADQQIQSTGSGSGPIFIAVADFNGDGQVDMAIANYYVSSISIFLGYGNGSFMQQSEFSAPESIQPASIAVGDINGDNRLDLVVSYAASDKIGITLGNGDGTFGDQFFYPTGTQSVPWSVVLTDLNNDQLLDIVVANSFSFQINIFFGFGNGSFTNQLQYSTGDQSWPAALAIGDFNQDKRLDIAVGVTTGITIFFNTDDYTFGIQNTYPVNALSTVRSVATGDLNDDSRLDFVTALYDADTVAIVIADFSASFINNFQYSTGFRQHPTSLVITDINNDKRLDLLLANLLDENVVIRLGYGNGYFAPDIILNTGPTSRPQYATVGYFNHDSALDLVIANPGYQLVQIMLGDGTGSFDHLTYYYTGALTRPTSIAVGNFNDDNWLDLVTATTGADSITVFLGNQSLALADAQAYTTGTGTSPSGIAVGDFNEDDQPDLVVKDDTNDQVEILFGIGDGTFESPIMYLLESQSSTTAIAVDDLDNDGHLDIVVTLSNSIGILFGFGNGSFASIMTYAARENSSFESLAIKDINGDHRLDVVTIDYVTNSINIYLGAGNRTFTDSIVLFTGTGTNPNSLLVADFNNDNILDVAVIIEEAIGIFFGYGNGIFSNVSLLSVGDGSIPQRIDMGDFNNDHHLDIVVTNDAPISIGIFYRNNDGTYRYKTQYSGNQSVSFQMVVARDLNNDQRLDAVLVDVVDKMFALVFGYVDETFINLKPFSIATSSDPQGIIVADLNNDSLFDIVITDGADSTIQVYLGSSIQLFEEYTRYSTGNGSQPSCVVVNDLNNDTRLDIIVTNEGTSTIGIFLGYVDGSFSQMTSYPTGNESAPYKVLARDLNNDNRSDLLVANPNADNIAIFFGLGDGTFKSIITYNTPIHSYPLGIAVDDLNDDGRLDIAVTNYASNNVMIFRGNGNGIFTVDSVIPMEYNAGPADIGTGDFNGDGRADIAVANFGTGDTKILLKQC